MQVNLRKNDSFITLSRTVDSDSSVRKGRSDPYEWYASFSIGNTTAGASASEIHSSVSFRV